MSDTPELPSPSTPSSLSPLPVPSPMSPEPPQQEGYYELEPSRKKPSIEKPVHNDQDSELMNLPQLPQTDSSSKNSSFFESNYPKNFVLKSQLPFSTTRTLPKTEDIDPTFLRMVFIIINTGPVPRDVASKRVARIIGKNDSVAIFFPQEITSKIEGVEVWCLVEKGRTGSRLFIKKGLSTILSYMKVRTWKYAVRDTPISKKGYLKHKSKTDTKEPFFCINIDNNYTLWVENGIYQNVDKPEYESAACIEKDQLSQSWTKFSSVLDSLLAKFPDEELPSPPSPPSRESPFSSLSSSFSSLSSLSSSSSSSTDSNNNNNIISNSKQIVKEVTECENVHKQYINPMLSGIPPIRPTFVKNAKLETFIT